MITADAAATASDLIWRLWEAGEVIPRLPGDLTPETRADGYAIQSGLSLRTAKGLVGWKIAATSKAGQSHIGVDGPLAGRLLAERTVSSGGTLSFRGNRMRVAEPEFAFRAGRDLGPRPTPYTVDEVMAAMDALIPAIEVPDSRFTDFAKVGGPQLIADNACAHQFVLGEPAACDWRSLDLASYRVHATVKGRYERDGIGANVLGDPRLALAWLVNELSGLGLTLTRGQVVTTGTCMVPLEIQAGDHVHADFGVLGRVEVLFDA